MQRVILGLVLLVSLKSSAALAMGQEQKAVFFNHVEKMDERLDELSKNNQTPFADERYIQDVVNCSSFIVDASLSQRDRIVLLEQYFQKIGASVNLVECMSRLLEEIKNATHSMRAVHIKALAASKPEMAQELSNMNLEEYHNYIITAAVAEAREFLEVILQEQRDSKEGQELLAIIKRLEQEVAQGA